MVRKSTGEGRDVIRRLNHGTHVNSGLRIAKWFEQIQLSLVRDRGKVPMAQ
jgi:hypothetical protein